MRVSQDKAKGERGDKKPTGDRGGGEKKAGFQDSARRGPNPAYAQAQAAAERGDCPLCDADERTADNIWYAYADRLAMKDAFRAAKRLLGSAVEWDTVTQHLYHHHWVQPQPPGRLVKNLALQEVMTGFSRYMFLLLQAVYRGKALSKRQIYIMFYIDHAEDSEALREQMHRDLQRLVFRSFLYQHWPENKGALQFDDPGPFYFINQRALPILERLEGHEISFNEYVPSLAKIKEFNLESDSRFLDVIVRLRACLYGRRFHYADEMLQAHLAIEHWIPPHALHTHLAIDDRKEIHFSPAGLVGMRVETISGSLSTILPLWLHYDRGIDTPQEIVDRLNAYTPYLQSTHYVMQFPRLAEHKNPGMLVVVCDSPYRRDEIQETLHKQTTALAMPTYLTDRASFSRDPYDTGILVHSGDVKERYSLIDQLIEHNKRIIQTRVFASTDRLTDRPSGQVLAS